MNEDELMDRLMHQCAAALEEYNNACDAPDLLQVRFEMERLILALTMHLTDNNKCAASKMLGMNRATLRSKLKRCGLYVLRSAGRPKADAKQGGDRGNSTVDHRTTL